jgi:hypothetical protein
MGDKGQFDMEDFGKKLASSHALALALGNEQQS